MYYHLILTDKCNLQCSYCRGRFDDEPASCEGNNQPADFEVGITSLCSFLEQDPGAVVIFYGGEPLLRTDLVEKFTQELPVKRFLLHTNGTLLDQPDHDTLSSIEKILLSIDGGKKCTDANRGIGTYDRVIKNVEKIRNEGYDGEIVARMTVERGTSVRDAVHHIDNLPLISSVHWQLNAMFYEDYAPAFTAWTENEYNPAIRVLVREWVEIMKEGRVARWYPFLAPISEMLQDRCDDELRCGCGFENFTITTDGKIVNCPCMYGFEGATLGHIDASSPDRLPKVRIAEPCNGCDIRRFCGGRCLYAHTASLWPEEGRMSVCATVRFLKETLESALPEIKQLISEGTIKEEDFCFERYWGCEIIP